MRKVFQCLALSTAVHLLPLSPAYAEDWPTYLHDNARSAISSEKLVLPLNETWIYRSSHRPQPAWPPPGERDYWHKIRRLRPLVTFDRAFQVAVADGTVFFGSSADDKVYALDAVTGEIRWTFFTGGPVRLAPTVHAGKVYVGSDDGRAYCLDAETGDLVWKIRPGQDDRQVLGNGRMISLWPIRTGIIIKDNVAYFLAGLFPIQGVYLCAVDANDGSVLWKKRVDNVSPQGHLLASQTRLIVPTGRTAPAIFDRQTGAFLGMFEGQGGAYALLLDEGVVGRSGRSTGELGLLDTGAKEKIATFNGLRMIVDRGMAYMLNDYEISALDRARYIGLAKERDALHKRRESLEKKIKETSASLRRQPDQSLVEELVSVRVRLSQIPSEMKRCLRWTYQGSFPYSMILAGNILFAGGDDTIVALDTRDGKEVWVAAVSGRPYCLSVADGRLYVSTDEGMIYCFSSGDRRRGIIRAVLDREPYPEDELAATYSQVAQKIIEETGISKGYCLVLGSEEGRLAYELAKRSELKIIGVEDNPEKASTARIALDKAGIYGTRVVIEERPLVSLPYVSNFANLVVSDRTLLTGELPISCGEVLRVLRPYGGVAWLGQPEKTKNNTHELTSASLREWVVRSAVTECEIQEEEGTWVVIRRGAAPGGGEWTHLYAEPGNSACSQDTLEGPMTIQWFGEPGPQEIVDRHHRPMSPLYKDGRLFVPANDRIIAVDAYNGTLLWKLDVPYSRRIGAMKDSGQMVLADDHLYVAAQDECKAVDVETGKVRHTMQAPQLSEERAHDWGYLAVVGDQIFGSGTKAGASFYELSEATCYLLEGDFRELILCDYLFSKNRYTGETLWTYGNGVIFNNTIAIGDGKVYCVESRNSEAVSDPDGRLSPNRFCESETYLLELDMRTGKRIWERPVKFPFQHIMYLSYADGVILVSGSYNVGNYVHYGLYAFDAKTGEFKWENSYQGDKRGGTHGEQWQHPVIIGRRIVSRPYEFDLQTGVQGSYRVDRGGHGCGGLSASASYLFGRGWNPRMYRIHEGEENGVPLTLVNRPGCWINIIPCGGLVLMPESSSGCTCQFPMQVSIALTPEKTSAAGTLDTR